MSIANEWELKTRSVRPRSAELKELDKAALKFGREGMGPGQANKVNLDTAFANWKGARPAEYQKIRVHADALDKLIEDKWNRPGQRNLGAGATVAQKRGYVVAADPCPSTPFTSVEIQKMNEAIARSKRACELARDAVIKVVGRSASAPATTPVEQAYVDYFGAFDTARAQRVLANYKTLCQAFANTPQIVDWRQKPQYGSAFAAASRGGVTNGVKVYMGGAFFNGTKVQRTTADQQGNLITSKEDLDNAYDTLTDYTVATFIHEFAHASFWAVDAPPVNKVSSQFANARAAVAQKQGLNVEHGNIAEGYSWKLTPDLSDPNSRDYGLSPDMWVQASTPKADKELAAAAPHVAVRNADNYGQFARIALKSRE
ncbi:MAG: hypothetical protein AB8B93_10820 [Pseudomonadales bacterium]